MKIIVGASLVLVTAIISYLAFSSDESSKPNLSFDEGICDNTATSRAIIRNYTEGLRSCYDVNHDGKLDIDELDLLVEGIACGSTLCPANPLPVVPPEPPAPQNESHAGNSTLITSREELTKLTNYFNGSPYNLTTLYSSNGEYCNRTELHAALDN